MFLDAASTGPHLSPSVAVRSTKHRLTGPSLDWEKSALQTPTFETRSRLPRHSPRSAARPVLGRSSSPQLSSNLARDALIQVPPYQGGSGVLQVRTFLADCASFCGLCSFLLNALGLAIGWS